MIGIRPATAEDAAAIAQIYAPYVVTSSVSFEDNPPSPGTIADRMEYRDGFYPWLVAASSDDGTVLGFAYATQFRERHAYRFAVETSVYVAGELQRNGVGRMRRPVHCGIDQLPGACALACRRMMAVSRGGRLPLP